MSTRTPPTLTTRRFDADAPRSGVVSDIRCACRAVLDSRGLLLELVRRDLVVRYKQTLMGVAWAFVVPLAGMLVFTMVFTRAVQVEAGMPYPLFAYAGLLLWTLVAAALRSATTSLTLNHALVTKVPFPRAVLPLASVVVALVDFLVGAVLLVGLMIYYGVTPDAGLFLVPLIVAVTLVLTAGLALLLALANLFYRDVAFILGLGLTLWMFLSSVVYPVELVGGRLGAALRWNPLNPILDSFRASLFGGPPGVAGLGAAAAGSVVILLIGIVLFHRLEPRFAEAI